jgi:streptogramin lyase
MLRRHARALAATALGLATMAVLTTPAAATNNDARHSNRFPTEFPLPVGFLPEGIAIGDRPVAYFGSRADGDIFRVNLATGEGSVISEGPGAGNPSVGLKIDQRGRLFVSGGGAGSARVVNVHNGAILASYQFVVPIPGANNTFINDVVLTPDGAYYTDSRSAVLFRVNPKTGVATAIDLGGETVVNGDGLLLAGRTLYVVQNRLNTVAVIRLNHRGTAGTVVQRVTDPRFDVPTTVAKFGDRLYLPNARFGTPSPETATYNAVAIPRP